MGYGITLYERKQIAIWDRNRWIKRNFNNYGIKPFLTLMCKLRENHKDLTDTVQYVHKHPITPIQKCIKASEGRKSVYQIKHFRFPL